MKEQTWLVFQQHGMVIEEAMDDGNIGKFEDHALAEKFALQLNNLGSKLLSDSRESKEQM
jgi:hypothetical protein